jgi:hypothetical protein
MIGNRYTATMASVVSTVWGLSLVALMLLWRRRPHSVLDIWLMVVMCAWLFDIALSAVLNQGRFDLGFYAGRLYGLLAATFVLVVLLLESGKLHTRLDRLHDELAAHNRTLEETVRERTARMLQSEKVATMGSLLAGVARNSITGSRCLLDTDPQRRNIGLKNFLIARIVKVRTTFCDANIRRLARTPKLSPSVARSARRRDGRRFRHFGIESSPLGGDGHFLGEVCANERS